MARTPAVIGKYQVVDRLGQGGMGTLYLARDPGLDRLVAIKVLRGDFEDEELRERFSREARSVSRLNHPNIVTIFEYGDFEGQPFIAMQYIAGESLSEIIHRRANVSLDRKLQMVDELCAGMAAAHRARIVHRDLKPANIMLDTDGGTIKILDFGIARNLEANVTLYTQVIGTPSYMSPEQADGRRVDHRSDIFAIGAVAYELLSYRKAFDGDSTTAIQNKILAEEPVSLVQVCPGLDPSIAAIVHRALAKDPATRYQDLDTMRSDLSRAIERAAAFQDATVVMAAPEVVSSAQTPRPSPHLEQRRANQIKMHLEAAAAAMRDGNYDAAIESCEHILLLDATHSSAIAMLQKARSAADRVIVERHLADARDHLGVGALTLAERALTSAIKLGSGDPAVTALQRELQQARRDVERARERAADAEAALTRARASFRDGAFESAVRAASEALAHVPDLAEARVLKQRAADAIEARAREREQERLAAEAIASARAQFKAGQHASAIGALEQFNPKHPLVDAALEDLQRQHDAIEEKRRREEERRRAEEAARHERLNRIRALLAASHERLKASDYNGALSAIADAEGLDPTYPGLAALRNEALSARSEAEAAAQRRREAAERQAQAEARARELERLAVEAVANARAKFEGGHHAEAITSLQAFRPQHPVVTSTLEELRSQRDAIDAQRRRDEERQRAAEAARQERLNRVRALLATSGQRLKSLDFDGALAAITDAERLEPSFPGLDELRSEALSQRAEAEATARAAADRRQEATVRLTRAERLVGERELDKALDEVRTALTLVPGDSDAARLQATIRRAVEDRERAEAAERQARAEAALRLKQEEEKRRREEEERLRVEEHKQREVADRLAAAERLRSSLDLDKALAEADAALALDPGNREVRRLRMTIQQAQEDRQRTEAAERQAQADAKLRFEQEEEKRRREEEERLRAEELARQERLARAAAEAEAQAAVRLQQEVAGRLAAAERLLGVRQFDDALAETAAALALDPDNSKVRRLRTTIQQAVEDRQRAEAAERRAQEEAAQRLKKEEDQRRREEEKRRLAQERELQDRRKRVSKLLTKCRQRLDAEDHKGALEALAKAEQIEPESAELAELRSRAIAFRDAAEAAARIREKAAEERRVADVAPLPQTLGETVSGSSWSRAGLIGSALVLLLVAGAAIAFKWMPSTVGNKPGQVSTGAGNNTDSISGTTNPGPVDPQGKPTPTPEAGRSTQTTGNVQTNATAGQRGISTGAPNTVPPNPGTPTNGRSDQSTTPAAPGAQTGIEPSTSPTSIAPPPPPPAPVDVLAPFRTQFQTQLRQGRTQEALATAVDALRRKGDDTEFQRQLGELFKDAQNDAMEARTGAEREKAEELARSAYEGAEREFRAGRDRGVADATGQAVRQLWEAAKLFTAAANEAKRIAGLQADRTRNQQLISGVLGQIKTAYESRNANAVAQVLPLQQQAVNTLARTFSDSKNYALNIQPGPIVFSDDGQTATVVCNLQHSFDGVGKRQTISVRAEYKFSKASSGAWRIESMSNTQEKR